MSSLTVYFPIPQVSPNFECHFLIDTHFFTMVAQTQKQLQHPPTTASLRPDNLTKKIRAYPNDSNACSPNGKGPAQGVPGGSSHRGYGRYSLAHANTGESARFAPSPPFAAYLQPGY